MDLTSMRTLFGAASAPPEIFSISADSENDSVKKIDLLGNIEYEGIDSTRDAIKVAFAPNGDYYVWYLNGDIRKLENDASAWVITPSTVSTISCMCADGSYVYVGWTNGDVNSYAAADGTINLNISPHAGTVRDIAVDPSGNLYTCSADDTIKKINASGTTLWTNTRMGANEAKDIAVDSAGRVYASSAQDDTVIRIEADNSNDFLVTGLVNPTGMAADGDGYIYFINNSRVVKYETASMTEVWSADPIGTGPLKISERLDELYLFNLNSPEFATDAIFRLSLADGSEIRSFEVGGTIFDGDTRGALAAAGFTIT